MSYANPTPEQLERSRKYRREWYYRNRESAKKRTYQNKVETIRRNKERINEIRRSTPCTDCGLSWPHYVMDFDHVAGGKIGNVMVMVNQGQSWKRLEEEITKCELVCANCHRKRTYERLLAEGQEPDLYGSSSKGERRSPKPVDAGSTPAVRASPLTGLFHDMSIA